MIYFVKKGFINHLMISNKPNRAYLVIIHEFSSRHQYYFILDRKSISVFQSNFGQLYSFQSKRLHSCNQMCYIYTFNYLNQVHQLTGPD